MAELHVLQPACGRQAHAVSNRDNINISVSSHEKYTMHADAVMCQSAVILAQGPLVQNYSTTSNASTINSELVSQTTVYRPL